MAEQRKGSALKATEVESIRDKSPCIMMEAADAEKMAQSRGYVDVNPRNCWADWHRLRTQMTGKGCLPKIVLCIPGDEDFRVRSQPILDADNVQHEFKPHDERLVNSFRASSMTHRSFTAQDFARIGAHTSVLYILSENYPAGAAPQLARTFLNLGRRLLDVGGFAVKCESSGVSHSPDRWKELDSAANHDSYQMWAALFRAFVVFPIASKTDLYSCGMHLLGTPDLIIARSAAETPNNAGIAPSAVVQLFDAFGMYLIGECQPGAFASGDTFSVDQESTRYRVLWEPCIDYAEDDFFFNPFGRFRFTRIQ